MTTPRLTIVTVTYNAQEHIQATLQSILAQTFLQLEWLLVDGGSSDRTVSVAKALLEKSNMVFRIVSEPDQGIYDAMNKGLKLAQGDYILFLNAGDVLYGPQSLGSLFEDNPTEDLLYAPLALMRRGQLQKIIPVPPKLGWKDWVRGMVVSHQGMLFRRKVALPYDLSFRYTSDLDWCIRCLKQATSTRVHPHPLVCYQGGGFSELNFIGCWKDNFRIIRQHYSWIDILGQVPRYAHEWLRYVYRSVQRRGAR